MRVAVRVRMGHAVLVQPGVVVLVVMIVIEFVVVLMLEFVVMIVNMFVAHCAFPPNPPSIVNAARAKSNTARREKR